MEDNKDAEITEDLEIFKKCTVLLPIILVSSGYFLLRQNPRVKHHLNKFPGPKTTPALGNTLQFLIPHAEILPLMRSWMQTYGKTYRMWIGNIIPYVLTCDVHVIEKLLSGSTYLDKGKYDYSLLHAWLGTGLLTAPGSKWGPRRKMLTPAFHFKILEDFIPIFNEQASVLLECLEKDDRGDGKTFNMYPYITNCTLDIICETAMGKKIQAQTSRENKSYVDAVNGMCALFLDKNLRPWLRVPLIYKLSSVSKKEEHYLRTLKQFTFQVIHDKKAERKRRNERGSQTNSDGSVASNAKNNDSTIYGKQRKAFLDLLLDTADGDSSLSDSDIREEVDTFMFEGHDTTAVNLGWTLLLLAIHPECQKLVQKELDDIFSDDPNRDVTTADISKMKYLEFCVKESLRLFPSVPLITRQITTDLELDDGRTIPEGATVMIANYMVHRLEEHFSEPDEFIPTRFLSDDVTSAHGKKRHPYAYIPFSAGSRNCIGQKFAMMEEKVVLAKLLRKYTISTIETMKSLVPLPDVVMRCENGVNVRLVKR